MEFRKQLLILVNNKRGIEYIWLILFFTILMEPFHNCCFSVYEYEEKCCLMTPLFWGMNLFQILCFQNDILQNDCVLLDRFAYYENLRDHWYIIYVIGDEFVVCFLIRQGHRPDFLNVIIFWGQFLSIFFKISD